MKFISVIYMSRCNFWCMTRGDSSHLNFQLQKVDLGPSGRQNWRKTIEFWKIFYIHFIRDPKGITYVAFFLQIESHAKMTWSTGCGGPFWFYCQPKSFELGLGFRDLDFWLDSLKFTWCKKLINLILFNGIFIVVLYEPSFRPTAIRRC